MVYICGDTHNIIDIDKLDVESWEDGAFLTKNDYLIVAGDFGLIWDLQQSKREQELIEWYNSKPWTTLFIDGNHENFNRLFSDEFPEIEMFGSKVKKISDSIFYLQRGNIYTIDRMTFFTFGGGQSIDKNRRHPNVSWWPQEIPDYEETNHAIQSLLSVQNCVDVIITHTCSNESFEELANHFDFSYKSDSEKSLKDFFSWVQENVSYAKWYFGHFHADYNLSVGNQHALYAKEPMLVEL